MDFQTDFLGLDNVSTYYNATPMPSSPARRRTSTMSSSSSTSSSTTTSPRMSSSRTSQQYSPPPSTHRNLHTYNHHRQASDLSVEIDAGSVAAFGALRQAKSTSPSSSSSIVDEAEKGSHSSTSSPIAIPARTSATRTTMSARRKADLAAGVVGMRRAMDMAGFGAHMNS